MSNTIAIVPEMTFVKYKTAIVMAASILMILSAVPMFFFIGCGLRFMSYTKMTSKKRT